ncbi:MAG: threonylcarbamoyl-AMP synthase [Hyphomonadaceae bacterium]|nr:threonylcarbamoyl-AMP synthase [Hyphomonadaceae bacterium]
MAIQIAKATPQAILEAAELIKRGGLVAVPTETVYGIAADAANPEAVARLYQVKGRPRFNPLIAHVNGLAMAEREGVLNGLAAKCAQEYWPGPLTLVVPVRAGGKTCELGRAGLPSIALRHPGHSVAHDLVTALGRPVVAPSANRSGRISPVSAQDVAEELGHSIDLILDGGRSPLGMESTILGFLGDRPQLLRPGGLERGRIEHFLQMPLAAPVATGDKPTAPGQLSRHYSPNARLRLNVIEPEPGEVFIGFGDIKGDCSLSPKGDLRQAAASLYPLLRHLDRTHDRIAICPIPQHGLGEAINDRLRRAAHRD